jgi:transcription initiation factor TFIID subunit 2
MKAICNAMIPTESGFHFSFNAGEEENKRTVFSELDRLLRIDRWLPSFQHTVSQSALEAKELLSVQGINVLPMRTLLLYARDGVFDLLRAQAFDILLHLGALRHSPLVKLIFYTLRSDPSPFVRTRLITAIERGFGYLAVTGNSELRKPSTADEMVIEEDAAQSLAISKDRVERATIAGAIQALRKELSGDQTLKEEMWKCAKYYFYIRWC